MTGSLAVRLCDSRPKGSRIDPQWLPSARNVDHLSSQKWKVEWSCVESLGEAMQLYLYSTFHFSQICDGVLGPHMKKKNIFAVTRLKSTRRL